jgi:hypothetical protein
MCRDVNLAFLAGVLSWDENLRNRLALRVSGFNFRKNQFRVILWTL